MGFDNAYAKAKRKARKDERDVQTGSTAGASQDASIIPPSQPDPSTQPTPASSMKQQAIENPTTSYKNNFLIYHAKKKARKAAQTGSTAGASQDASIPPSQPDLSTQPTQARSVKSSSVAKKSNALSTATASNVSSRPRRSTSDKSYAEMKGDGDRVERRHTKEIVDLVLKLSREDAETAGNLLSSVLNDTSLKGAKDAAGIVAKEENEINADIVNNIRLALPKLINLGGNINSQRQTLCDGILVAVVGESIATKQQPVPVYGLGAQSNMIVGGAFRVSKGNPHQHPVRSFATALGVKKNHIVFARKRREESRDQESTSYWCEHEGCTKAAEGSTSSYCKTHGGGRKCEHESCIKLALGRTVFCSVHGGGKRCVHEGCGMLADGSFSHCKAHGGGKRCQHEDCTKSARGSGNTSFCAAHGGGKRCQQEGCTKCAEGNTGYCKAHGGGKRCQYVGCTKSAEGSPVSPFCKAHRDGNLCQREGCTGAAERSTSLCTAHGGGEPCEQEGGCMLAEESTSYLELVGDASIGGDASSMKTAEEALLLLL